MSGLRRLLAVELTRLRWRRAVVALVVVAVLVPAAVAVSVAWQTRPISASELDAARAQVAAESERPALQREVDRCVARPRLYGRPARLDDTDAAAVRAFCEQRVLPQVEWYVGREPLRVAEVQEDNGGVVVLAVLGMLALVIGATYAGHDWATGSMSNQLLFEARRARLWTAKALAVILAAAVLAVVVLAAFWGSLLGLERLRGEVSPPGTLALVGEEAWRGVVLVAAAALAGYALTMLLRSTVATLGLLFVAVVVVPLLLAVTGLAGVERWQPQNNVAAWLSGPLRFPQYDDPACNGNRARGEPRPEGCVVVVDRADAAAYLGGLLVVSSGASLLSFRRRDVP